MFCTLEVLLYFPGGVFVTCCPLHNNIYKNIYILSN